MDTFSLSTPVRKVTALTAVAPLVWGTTYLVTTELLPPDRPFLAAVARALPAGLLALALGRTLPRGSWWWRATVLGTLNIGVFFPLLFVAAERLPGGVAATLGATQPILVALLSGPVLGQRPTRRALLWGVCGVVGIALVVLGPSARLDALGVAAGLAGGAAMALGVTLTKRWGRPDSVGPVAYAGWQLTAGGLVLAPTLLLEGLPSQLDAHATAGYLWLGLVGGLLAYTIWFAGLRRLPAVATALLGLLSPLMAATLGALVLGQGLRPLQLVGFALALTALAAGQIAPRVRASGGDQRPPAPARAGAPVSGGARGRAPVAAP